MCSTSKIQPFPLSLTLKVNHQDSKVYTASMGPNNNGYHC